MREPKFEVLTGDITEIRADVLILKFAQAFYGADRHVANLLLQAGEDPTALQPKEGGFRILDGRGVVAARKVIFVGVSELYSFGYEAIRIFARRALAALAGSDPKIRHIAATISSNWKRRARND